MQFQHAAVIPPGKRIRRVLFYEHLAKRAWHSAHVLNYALDQGMEHGLELQQISIQGLLNSTDHAAVNLQRHATRAETSILVGAGLRVCDAWLVRSNLGEEFGQNSLRRKVVFSLLRCFVLRVGSHCCNVVSHAIGDRPAGEATIQKREATIVAGDAKRREMGASAVKTCEPQRPC